MRDDFIQGIMFSRSNLVDLRRMSRSERLMYRMLATKRALQGWPIQSAPRFSQREGFIAVRNGAHRKQDLAELAERFKTSL